MPPLATLTHVAALVALARAVLGLKVTPAELSVFSEEPGPHNRSLVVTNPSDANVTVVLRASHGSPERRLAPAPAGDAVGPGLLPHAGANCSSVHRLLLKFRASGAGGEASRRRLAEDEGLGVLSWAHLRHVGLDVAELGCGEDAEVALRRLRARYGGDLELAEADRRVFPVRGLAAASAGTTNDPYWRDLWGLKRVGMEPAWDRLERLRLTPRTTVVAVLDTGVAVNHEDLRDAMWTNAGEIPGNGIDDDGNGFVDDVHGYDFYSGDSDPSDADGHGTHCAGVVAGVANNSLGVVGVAGRYAKVQIMALRFIGEDGGFESDAMRALDYAVMMGAKVSSNSWGGTDGSASFRAALASAAEAGHLFVSAAGNEASDNDAKPSFPCSYEANGSICVAATTSGDALAPYSNYGASSVDIAAPGSDILSTVPSGYQSLSGTSMACPHVAGAAALVQSVFFHLTPARVGELILESVSAQPWLEGVVVGAGLLDVERLIALAEADTWLLLTSPDNSTPSRLITVDVPAQGQVEVGVLIGGPELGANSYSAEVSVSWVNGSVAEALAVPVRLVVAGWPALAEEEGGSSLDWGTLPIGASSTKRLEARNEGNGTLLIRVDAMPAPFVGGASKTVEVAPLETGSVSIACAPTLAGTWEEVVVLHSNGGLSPWEASRPGSVDLGEKRSYTLRCAAGAPPFLEVTPRSGAAATSGGVLRPLRPSAPAEWEWDLTAGAVTAPLALPPPGQGEVCGTLPAGSASGRVLLVARGTCALVSKALGAEAAGAVGIVVYDNTAPTTLAGMAMPESWPTRPGIPAFLVERDAGLALRSQLDGGLAVNVTLHFGSVNVEVGHPTRAAAAETMRVENLGVLPMYWRARLRLSTPYSASNFYAVSLLEGAEVDTVAWGSPSDFKELPWFRENLVDDGAWSTKLPFEFPFFGEPWSNAFISSNGFLSFDPDYAPRYGDGDGALGDAKQPNGLVAPFWDDLVCSNRSRISVAHLTGADGGCYAVWFEQMSWYDDKAANFASSDVVSFRVKVCADGHIHMRYHARPLGAGWYQWTDAGVETVDGASTVRLPLSFGAYTEDFAVSLTPWAVTPGLLSGLLERGEHADVTFSLTGEDARRGALDVEAWDESGAWEDLSTTLIEQVPFECSWRAGEFGECLQACAPFEGAVRLRSVECVGSDGETYPDDSCAACRDDPALWVDLYGDSCLVYEKAEYCTASGEYGPGWAAYFGSFEDYRNDGHTATEACCVCGGGSLVEPPPGREACDSPVGLESCTSTVTRTSTQTATSSTSTRSSTTATSSTQTSTTITVSTSSLTATALTAIPGAPALTTEVISSSVTLIGISEVTPAIATAVQVGVADSLGVADDQVVVLGFGAAAGRRLQGGWTIDFEVVFETPGAQGPSSGAASALAALQSMSADPAVFVTKFTEALVSQGVAPPASLQAVVREPDPITTVVAQRLPGPCGECAPADASDPCGAAPWRCPREVFCVAAGNISQRLPPSRCRSLPEIAASVECAANASSACAEPEQLSGTPFSMSRPWPLLACLVAWF